jgi:hypothetical protein
MSPLLSGQKIRLYGGADVCEARVCEVPLAKEGYWEAWCTTGSGRMLIHLYHDGRVIATTWNGNLWVFDRLETIPQKVVADLGLPSTNLARELNKTKSI